MKKQNFTQLKKTMSLEELNKFCKKVTEEYATSEPQFARTYFCERYKITVSCFYKILEYAVVRNLVEDVIVSKMMTKAIANQNLHKSGAGASSIVKYARMYTERYKYIAETMPVQEVKELARDFGDNPDISKAEFASAYGVPKRVIDYCLSRAIIENISDNRTVDAIEKRSINNAKTKNVQMTKEYFNTLRKKREENKKEITLK